MERVYGKKKRSIKDRIEDAKEKASGKVIKIKKEIYSIRER
jgi:hypothetical protein